MIEIEEMAAEEIHMMLKRVGYGQMGCAREERPYVVPIHYAYDEPNIYILTTEGIKTEFIAANAEVCLQVEEVSDPVHWRSVIANGRAEKLTAPEETERAMQFITQRNPTLTPAINRMWIDVWGRASVIAIYRIRPHTVIGRKRI